MVFHPPLWRSRQEAGAALADRLRAQEWPTGQTVLLALPRGGVPVGAEVARRLGLPLATWSVRKVADPSSPELAIGAVAAGGVVVWRDGGERAREQGWLQKEERELARRQALFGDPDPHHLQGRHLVVIDDGIATGMTVRAALLSLKQLQPASLTLAVPVVDREVAEELAPLVNRLEALALVDDLRAVGLWYEDFNQLSDREVIALLGQNQTVFCLSAFHIGWDCSNGSSDLLAFDHRAPWSRHVSQLLKPLGLSEFMGPRVEPHDCFPVPHQQGIGYLKCKVDSTEQCP